MLREAATLARQDLAGLRPEERVELLDRQLSGAPLLPAPAVHSTEVSAALRSRRLAASSDTNFALLCSP
jgi:hypothetical protein